MTLTDNLIETTDEAEVLCKCCICNDESYAEVCDECNSIYRKVIGCTFESEEEIKCFFDNEDIPPYQMRKLGREFNVYLNGV